MTIFHCWQYPCPVSILTFHMQLFLISILSGNSWFSTSLVPSSSLPYLHSSQVALIYCLLLHLCAQWFDSAKPSSFHIPLILTTYVSLLPQWNPIFLLFNPRLCHLFHSSSPNPFSPTTSHSPFHPLPRFHLRPLLPGLLINSLALSHQHPCQAASAITLEYIKEAQEIVSFTVPSVQPNATMKEITGESVMEVLPNSALTCSTWANFFTISRVLVIISLKCL